MIVRKEIIHWSILVGLVFLVPFSVVEFYLRMDGSYYTYLEKIKGEYYTYYGQYIDNRYWQYDSNAQFVLDHGDFRFPYSTNEFGHREKQQLNASDTCQLRVITLGDSFTEGVGSPYDSSWPRSLEEHLQFYFHEMGLDVRVYNAGVSGSDPIYDYVSLKERLFNLRPHLVVQAVNTSDLTDHLYRGGFERFQGDGVRFKDGPWWKTLYRFSHIVRMLADRAGIQPTLLSVQEERKAFDRAIDEYHSLFADSLMELTTALGAEALFIMQPMPDELIHSCCNHDHLSRLDFLLHLDGFNSMDLLEPMNKEVGADTNNRYHWPVDKHYNGRGYYILGKVIGDSVVAMTTDGRLELNLTENCSNDQ